jgi:hypothetical protein
MRMGGGGRVRGREKGMRVGIEVLESMWIGAFWRSVVIKNLS